MPTEQWRTDNSDKMQRYRRDWYSRNREHAKSKATQRKSELREWVKGLRQTLKCAQCGESHPGCLDFHHDDAALKDMSIAHAVTNGWSKKRILTEIDKCTVLCANCHRKLHWKTN